MQRTDKENLKILLLYMYNYIMYYLYNKIIYLFEWTFFYDPCGRNCIKSVFSIFYKIGNKNLYSLV